MNEMNKFYLLEKYLEGKTILVRGCPISSEWSSKDANVDKDGWVVIPAYQDPVDIWRLASDQYEFKIKE